MVQRTTKDAAVSCVFLVSGGAWPEQWRWILPCPGQACGQPLSSSCSANLPQGNNCELLLLSVQGGKALASCCVNTQLVFATVSSAGTSPELQEMGWIHVFHFLASLFSAAEECKGKNVNASPRVLKKAFGDNEAILFYEREMFQAGYITLNEYLCCKTKILLNKKSLEIQIKMFCFDNLGTGYWCIIETAWLFLFPSWNMNSPNLACCCETFCF